MNFTRHIVTRVVVLFLALALLGACSDSPLEKSIRTALLMGDTTQVQYDSIASLIKANSRQYHNLLNEDGEIDADALNALIANVGKGLRPPLSWDISKYASKPLSLTIYFERSGSMVPYDTPSGRGQLKKAVNDMINFFPNHDNVEINIVNDNIYPYRGTISDFLQDRNIYASTAGTGNASFTDFGLIFNKILEAQSSGNISVLVTDMIYSPANTQGVSVEKIFNEENSLATSIFRRYKGKSVIVNQLMGDYDGAYYPYNNQQFTYHGQRPFYLIIVCDESIADRISADPQFHNFLTPASAVNSFRFNQAQTRLNCNIIPDWKDNRGRFRVSHSEKGLLTNCEGDSQTDVFSFSLATNLKALNKDDAFLTNTENYTISSQNDFKFSVTPIEPSMINGNNRQYLEGNSHVITLTGILKSPRDEVTITLRNEFPDWFARCTSSDDTSPSAADFAHTTLGLSHFMQGIFTAFSTGNDNYTTITIKLQK